MRRQSTEPRDVTGSASKVSPTSSAYSSDTNGSPASAIRNTPAAEGSKDPISTNWKTCALFLQGVLLGAVDSVNVLPFLQYCIRSPRILWTVRDCALMNSILFASVWLVSHVFTLFPINSTGLLAGLWKSLFAVLWVLPIYATTQLLGVAWYEDLYRNASRLKHSSLGSAPPPPSAPTFATISELLLKAVVTLVFGVAAVVAGLIPFVGLPVSFVMSSWLHAYYCFDYRFLDQRQYDSRLGRPVPLRLTQILTIFEVRASYFLGFGATHMAMRLFFLEGYLGLSMFPSLAICSAVFALNVVMTVDAHPTPVLPKRVPVFTPAYAVAFRLLSKWTSPVVASTDSLLKVRSPQTPSNKAETISDAVA